MGTRWWTYTSEHEISRSISENAHTQPEPVIVVGITEPDQDDTRNGKKDRKQVVPFKLPSVTDVMVFVKDPQKSVHNIFMREPGHEFHEEKRGDDDQRCN